MTITNEMEEKQALFELRTISDSLRYVRRDPIDRARRAARLRDVADGLRDYYKREGIEL